jgi:hypothetical protein
MEYTDPILTDVEAFIERTGMPPTSFGMQATRNPNLVSLLRGGSVLRSKTRNRIKQFMDGYVASEE